MTGLHKLLQERDALEGMLMQVCRDNNLCMRSGDTASGMKDHFFRAIGKTQSEEIRNIGNEIRGKGQPFYILERKEGVFRKSPILIVFDPLGEYPQQNHIASVNSYIFNFRESTTKLAKSLMRSISIESGKNVEVRDIFTKRFGDVDSGSILISPPETENGGNDAQNVLA
ncbi:MAG: hypothetical protein KGH78_02555 [Candidatus Micrarchaeota archaeon]|nr:hypothetical protein [Candidatus Micrarchaeota archaeon]